MKCSPRRSGLRQLGRAVVAAGLLAIAPAAYAGTTSVTPLSPGASPLSGIQDDRIIGHPDPAARVRALADAGAAVIRVDLRWDLVAPSRPATPANPADPAYDWRQYDATVAAARALRLQVLFSVYGTPAWARDPGVPFDPSFENWSIRPLRAADFGAFAEAAARRYSPLGVRRWEGWNEPNISIFLRPQYVRQGGRWVAESPRTYAALQSAFYAAIKRVDPSAAVGGAVTAPAGDRCSDCPDDAPPLRVTPDDFIRALDAPGLRPPMDVVSHHPYPVTGPRSLTPPGRTYVDLYNLPVLIAAIDRTYLRGKRLWLTEYGFATSRVRQYPTFFTLARQANHIADAYRRFRATPRVRLVIYYLLQDHPDWASGVLRQDGRAKPGYAALALPFVATTSTTVGRGRPVTLAGQVRNAAGRVPVRIQRRNGAGWRTVGTVRTSADGTFRVALRINDATRVRAQWTGRLRSGARAVRTSPVVAIRVR